MVRSQKSPMLLAAEDRDPEITSQFFLPWFDSACDSRSHWCPFLTCGSYCRCPSRIHSGFAPSLFLGQKAVLLTTRSNLHDWYLPGWGHRWGEVLSPFRAFSAKDSGENKWGQGPKWHFHDCHFFFPQMLPLRTMTQFLKLLVSKGLAENPHLFSQQAVSVAVLRCLCGR